MWRASRGSMTIWFSSGPSGVPESDGTHFGYIGLSLKPATLCQVSPPSSVRNSPGGDEPAHHTPGSDTGPGSSQNVWLTARTLPSPSTLGNAGGRLASFHVAPRSPDRKIVGPR